MEQSLRMIYFWKLKTYSNCPAVNNAKAIPTFQDSFPGLVVHRPASTVSATTLRRLKTDVGENSYHRNMIIMQYAMPTSLRILQFGFHSIL